MKKRIISVNKGPKTNKNIEQTSDMLEMEKIMQETEQLLYRIPIFLSIPNRLNSTQQAFVQRLIREIRAELLFPRTLPRTEQYPEPPLTNVRRMVLSCYGLVAANLRQREVKVLQNNLGKVPMPPQEFWEGSAFSQIEPAMAYLYGLPLLLILESGVEETGFFQLGQGPFLRLTWDSKKPLDEFFGSIVWKEILRNWVAHVRNGYYIQTEPEFKYSCNTNNE